jgi:peptidoglycan hydrolase FlgJ
MDEIAKPPLCALPATATIKGIHSGRPATEHTVLDAVKDRDRLDKACADFEAIFVQQLFKTMRASVPASELFNGGRAEEIYTSMLDQQVSEKMAHGHQGIGLADQMRNKLMRYKATESAIKMR